MRTPLAVAAAAFMLAGTAHATPLELVYAGYLSAADTLGGTALGAVTPFEVRADFDSSAQLFSLEPGAAAYAPSSFTMTLLGLTYQVTTVQQDPVYGQTVVLFDPTSPDSNSPAYGGQPHYGVGFFSLGGGNVGVIGDWLSATPAVTLGTLQPTTFQTFYGVGYNDGPISLVSAGGPTILQLNDAYDYNSTNPSLTYTDGNVGSPTIPDNAAALVAAPEPGSMALIAGMLGGLSLFVPRRRGTARAQR